MRTTNRKIAHNTIIHLAGKLISLVLGLLIVVILTRYLGAEGYGNYTTVIAFLMFFGIIVDFGLTLTTVQMISDPNLDYNKTINNMISLRFLISFFVMLVPPIMVWFLPYPSIIKWGVVSATFFYFCYSFIQALTGVFQEKLQMWKVTISEVVGRIFLISIVGLVVYFGKSIIWVFAAMSAEGLIVVLLLFVFSAKFVKWKFEMDFNIWKEILKRSWPIALSISFNLIYLRMDTLILSLSRTQAEVGLYGATYRIIDVLTMLPAVFMGIVLPVITRYFSEARKFDLKNLMQKAFDTLMMFAVPVVFGAMIIAKPLMILIGGAEFAASGDILRVLILASGVIFVTSLFGYAIVGIKKQKQMMWGYLTVALITLIGYLIFIPKYGYWGAAWMTVFSEFVIMVWTSVIIYKTIRFFPSLNSLAKNICAALVMAFIIYFIRDWNVIIVLLISGLIYFSALYLLGGIKKSMIKELTRLK